MKAALYARVSANKQKEENTVETQIKALEEHCRNPKHDLQIYDKYIDNGHSGATLKRPALQKLLKDAEQGKFNKVLVYKTDRLARSLLHTVDLVLGIFEPRGISFKSITEPFDTSTLSGRALFGQLAIFADFERGMIRERTIEGKLRKVKEGKWMGSNAHYAYDIEKVTKKLVVNKERAGMFRIMVDWLLSGKSCYSIAKKLNEMGIPTWKKQQSWKIKKSVHLWRGETIRGMLINPIIIGKAKYDGVEILAPAIVSEEEFRQIKLQLKKNRTSAKRNTKEFYLLRRLLYCKRCGSALYGHKKRDYRRKNYIDQAYSCPSGRFKQDIPSCGLRRLYLPRIEEYIWNLTMELVTNSEKLNKAVRGKHLDLSANELFNEDQIKTYNASIKQYQGELDRILSLYARTEIITVEELEKKAGGIKAKIREAEEARNGLLEARDRILDQKKHLDNAQEYFKSIRSRLDTFSDNQKRELIQLLWKRITVDWNEAKNEHILELEGAIPIFKEGKEVKEKRHPVVTGPSRSPWPAGTTLS